MSKTFRITYSSIYEYESDVMVNDNELRVFPRREYWQQPLESFLESNPKGKIIYYHDRFGNTVARITIREVHHRVEFRIVSTVKLPVEYRQEPHERISLSVYDGLGDPHIKLFIMPSRLVDPSRLVELAHSIINSRDVTDILYDLTGWVYKNIEYKRGYTSVYTMAHEVVGIGRGVCQDKAHLLIGLLRALGIPARYVSGALTDTIGETHAWVEAYWPKLGWIPIDPTHNRVFNLGFYYVKFAHGRDYSDVPPVNGYYIGKAKGRIKQVIVIPEEV